MGVVMMSKARKLVREQAEFMSEQARVFRQAPGVLMRRAAAKSASGIKALQRPVHVVTRSGMRLTSLSQETLQSLLELQLEVVTSVLTNAAAQLERVARARGVRDLAGSQAEELRAARKRIAADIKRVIEILRRAGKGVRTVASDTYEDAVKPPEMELAPVPRAKPRRKAKRVVRKATRKTAATANR
jgi:phasin family protein